MKKIKKCVLLFSGGLDSRLALKIMQELNFKIYAIYFKLPFSCSNYSNVEEFCKKNKIKLKIFNCTKGKLLKEYLKRIKNAKFGRGAGYNPCIDCKIFMFSEAKKFADKKKINLIVSGEVLFERPMSQRKKALEIIEKESALNKRILRPLSAKLLAPTEEENNGVVQREYLYEICGKKRTKQIELAKKYKINYPNPAGGCLLCEKELKKRFKKLFEKKRIQKEIPLVSIGRHFIINNSWIILGRNKEENIKLKKAKIGKLIIPKFPGPSAIILGKLKKDILNYVNELIIAYSKKGSAEQKKKFKEFKI